jgi:tetratricopeptide (TPR) repeat protein
MQSTETVIKEKLDRARTILNNEYPYDPDVYSGPVEAAKSIFEEILVMAPDSVDALIGMGICIGYSPREYENAVSFFKRAIELRPENATPYHEAGRILLNAGERFGDQDSTLYTRAINYFHQAMERNYSPLYHIYRGLGTVYFRLGDYSESINCFEQAINMLEEGGWVPDIFWLCAEAHRALVDCSINNYTN